VPLVTAGRRERAATLRTSSEGTMDPLLSLPDALAFHILSLLPVDSLLLCRGVCASWKRFLDSDTLCWRFIKLSHCAVRPTLSLLRAAAAAARGHLETLDVRDTPFTAEELTAWLERAKADGGQLQLLQRLLTSFELDCASAELLVTAASSERVVAAAASLEVHCSVLCSPTEACRLLQLAPLRLDSLSISTRLDTLALDAAALGISIGSAKVDKLRLSYARLANKTVLETLTSGLKGVRELALVECDLQPASLPALTHLLTEGSLSSLAICGEGAELIRGPGAADFRDAILHSQLRSLELSNVSLFTTLAGGLASLAVCTDHASLRVLVLSGNKAHDGSADAAVGRQLGAMVDTLESLTLVDCGLGDEGMEPLFNALWRPTSRLRTLDASFNGVSRECARMTIFPAVCANASLRRLTFGYTMDEYLQAAIAIVDAYALRP
jgi:F-box domain/Leucine Rich repeat